VPTTSDLAAAADLFKTLSSSSRLDLLRLLCRGPATVTALAELSGLSQPLVSQHLRTLRDARLVTVTRTGREAVYAMTDPHVFRIVRDAVSHVTESRTST
jgi:DNA-binding transcriptional ArsR family regulator